MHICSMPPLGQQRFDADVRWSLDVVGGKRVEPRMAVTPRSPVEQRGHNGMGNKSIA